MTGQLIGLCGLAGSGKDSAAEVLVNQGWVRVSFADPMREALIRLNPDIHYRGATMQLARIVAMFGWDEAKRTCPPIRTLLQRFGTEVGRTMWGEDFWANQAESLITSQLQSGQDVVISDVRFPNEAKLIRNYGGRVIKIRRPGVGQMGHASEAMDFEVDEILHNEGSLEELHTAILEMIK